MACAKTDATSAMVKVWFRKIVVRLKNASNEVENKLKISSKIR